MNPDRKKTIQFAVFNECMRTDEDIKRKEIELLSL